VLTFYHDSFISEGTNITLHSYSLLRDPRYFSPYPEDFWPDRWLAPECRKSLNDVNKPLDANIKVVLESQAFIPFSVGPRVCVGKNLAMNELRVVVASMVQRFDMKFADGYDPAQWTNELKDFFVLEKGPLSVVLTEHFD
jgi:cytochrome P450